MYLSTLCNRFFAALVLLSCHINSLATVAKRQQEEPWRSSSFTRYIEYAETPFQRPSYFSVPFRVPPRNELQYISNELFAHLIREHTRHQQRVKLYHQNKHPDTRNHSDQQLRPTPELILRGVSQITELRQTPFQRFSHNSSALTYEEKRRRWKEDLKRRMRANKQPARVLGSSVQTPVGTAGRYYITFNPFSNAYQVSRRLPSYVHKEQFESESTPNALLSTVTQTTTTTTPALVVEHATEVVEDVEQLIRIPAAPKSSKKKIASPLRQILNLDYYDDDFVPDESHEDDQLLVTTTATSQPQTTTTPEPQTTTTSEPQTTTTPEPQTTTTPEPQTTTTPEPQTTTTTTRRPYTTIAITTQQPYITVVRPTDYRQPIIYPPVTASSVQPTTVLQPSTTTQRSALFDNYEDEAEDELEEEDDDFLWFKSGSRQPVSAARPADDPFSITVHNNDRH